MENTKKQEAIPGMRYRDSSLEKKEREKEKDRPVPVLLISLKKRDKLIL